MVVVSSSIIAFCGAKSSVFVGLGAVSVGGSISGSGSAGELVKKLTMRSHVRAKKPGCGATSLLPR